MTRIAKIIIVFLVTVILIGLSGYLYIFNQLKPVSDKSGSRDIKVEIPMGSNTGGIAKILKDNGVIKNEKIFYYYVRYKKEGGFQAGTYYIPSSSKVDEITTQLKYGKVYSKSNRVTIPEGYTIKQIARLLEKKGIISEDKFLYAAQNGKYTDVELLKLIPEKGIKYHLEGFLFPKTYDFKVGATAEEIVHNMLIQTETEIPKEWYDVANKNHKNWYQIMKLASIIERETISNKERAKVAGVYYNRISKGMKLQADATIQYLFGEQKKRLLFKDLKIDSKYNTYLYKGLPPSPISNPGLESIKAAVYPEKHKYLFYVTKKDGSNEHYFSSNYKEHEHYIRLSNKEKK